MSAEAINDSPKSTPATGVRPEGEPSSSEQVVALLAARAIPIADIDVPEPWKREVKPDRVDELAKSIQESGLLAPIVVRPLVGGRFELVAGKTRLLAMKKLGMGEIMASVKDADDAQTEIANLTENLTRWPLKGEERTKALVRWKELHVAQHGPAKRGRAAKGAPRPSYTKTAAKTTGKSESTIKRDLARQNKLVQAVKAAVEAKTLTQSQADELAKLSANDQEEVLPRVMGKSRDETRMIVQEKLGKRPPTTAAQDPAAAPTPAVEQRPSTPNRMAGQPQPDSERQAASVDQRPTSPVALTAVLDSAAQFKTALDRYADALSSCSRDDQSALLVVLERLIDRAQQLALGLRSTTATVPAPGTVPMGVAAKAPTKMPIFDVLTGMTEEEAIARHKAAEATGAA